MNLYLRDPDRPEWNAHSRRVLEMLGIEGTRLPTEGMPPRSIQGITVWVEPLAEDRPVRWNGREGKRSDHRVKAACPACQKIVSVGRLHQHAKVHGRSE